MSLLLNSAPAAGLGRFGAIIRALRLPLVLLALLGLSACSAVRLSYNNAPELMYWWLDGFIDFDKTQAKRVRADLAALARWHRKEELPLVADLLQSAQTLAAQTQVSGEQICSLYERSTARMEALVQRALPGAAAVATTLQAGQLKSMAAAYDKKNAKWREEWMVNDADGVAKRTLKLRERLEDFYGSLSPVQIRQLQVRLERTAQDQPLHYSEIVRRQQLLLQTLAQLRQADTGTAQSVLTSVAQGYLHSPDATYRAAREASLIQTCEAMAELHRSATPMQRTAMVGALQGYARDVQSLIAATP
jgi:Family of unknown function (DUF6279)